MKNVILFFPRLSPDEITETRFLMPLSLLYVATPLREAGYDVSIVDARLDDDWQAELRRRVAELDPICVGISSLTGIQLRGAMEAAKIVKELDRRIPIVWGGVHASLLPAETMREEFVDVVAVGEGEETFTELVRRLDRGESLEPVMGIWHKQGGVPKKTLDRPKIDLNELPPLAYDLVDMSRYYRPFWDTEPTGPTFITSRGCPFQCAYCYIEVFDQRLWRAMRPEKVRENIEHLLGVTQTKSVFCLDDMFFTDIRRVKGICRELIDHELKIELDNVNCRADAICRFDQEIVDLLVEAGVRRLFVGLETGSNRVLKMIQKGSTREQAIKANRILASSPIKPIYAFMAGFPHETIEDTQQTLDLMAQLLDENPNALITETSFYSPFPGTTLYSECLRMGIRLPETMEEWATMSYNRLMEEFFTREQIDFFYKVKTLSAYIDHKNYETMRHANKNGLKRFAAKVISKEFRWRVKNQAYQFFPERRLLAPPSDV
jgi:radical SAM superfamily enzyme YgiQ (UPF0313 family)